MTPIDLVQEQIHLGVKAPAFAWWAAAAALAFVALVLVWLARRIVLLGSSLTRASRRLRDIGAANTPGQGLNPERFGEMDTAFDGAPSLMTAWRSYAGQCVFRRGTQGSIGVFSSESSGGAFAEGLIIEPVINRSFFQAVPGIVTGFGLLVTFIAILVALKDVKLEEN